MELQIVVAILSVTTAVFAILWLRAFWRPAQEPEGQGQALEAAQAEFGESVKVLEAEVEGLLAARVSLEKERDAAAESAASALSAAKADASASKVRAEKAKADAKQAKADLEQAKVDLEKAQADLEESVGKGEKLRDAQKTAEEKLKEARDHGALALLSWLQREGRLIDFLKEDIDDYQDEQVGAAVRAIHKGCLKVLTEGLELEAILEGEEESPVQIEEGFDPVAIQLTGNVKGEPPFKGTLMHHGWRAKRVQVPVPETVDPHVLAPAEVEL